MQVYVFKEKDKLDEAIAQAIVNRIKVKPNLILGLATGSSPLGVYNRLIRFYKAKEVSFKNVMTFNLDEYVGLLPTHIQSYRYFMNHNLFNHIDINLENTNIPSLRVDEKNNTQYYDLLIASKGGIDLQILGIGANGHIAFNEPGTSFNSLTHITDLSVQTRLDNSRFFSNFDEVPSQAITMGLASIMNSKEIHLIATGKNKAQAVKAMIEETINLECPASILQNHLNVTIYLDEAAASLLKKELYQLR